MYYHATAPRRPRQHFEFVGFMSPSASCRLVKMKMNKGFNYIDMEGQRQEEQDDIYAYCAGWRDERLLRLMPLATRRTTTPRKACR